MTQFHTYYVKNLADRGQPYEIRAASKHLAAKIIAGRDPLPEWQFCVWTESEWKAEKAPTEFYAI